MPSVRLNGLRKAFGPQVAVQDVTVEFAEGEMSAVLGPSGCGKTTTLNLIAGFEAPDRGTIHFGERPVADPARRIEVPPNRRNLGMVFQSYALWPHLTVGENVAYGLKMHNVPRAERETAVRRALGRVRLNAYVDRYPHALSGGQQQRVALARAIAYSPEILLFDEPLSNLDAQLREEMRSELKEIRAAVGVTAVYVTHDQTEAMVLSDRIVVMSEGRIRQIGTPRQLYEEPANVEVARFLGKSNVLEAVVVDGAGARVQVKIEGIDKPLQCRAPAVAHARMTGALSIRPEGIHLRRKDGASKAALVGRVDSATYLGNLNQYQVVLAGGQRLDVENSASDLLVVGEEVAVAVDPERCYFIAAEPGAAKRAA